MISRIDIIGSNGNEGTHYLVELVARAIAGKDANQILMGKNAGKRRYELYIDKAIEVVEIVEDFRDGCND